MHMVSERGTRYDRSCELPSVRGEREEGGSDMRRESELTIL